MADWQASPQVVAQEDFAFVVADAVSAGALVDCVRAARGELVEYVRVFEVYSGAQAGEGLKSVAVNVRMRVADHTLSAEQVLESARQWSRRRRASLGLC